MSVFVSCLSVWVTMSRELDYMLSNFVLPFDTKCKSDGGYGNEDCMNLARIIHDRNFLPVREVPPSLLFVACNAVSFLAW
jgi:hypothetical protein